MKLFLACFLLAISYSAALLYPSRSCARALQMSSEIQSLTRANLNGDTLWRISFYLEKSGHKTVEAAARIRFVDDRNYEPPQGRIFVEDDFQGLIRVNDKGYTGIWSLSEDKNDRKDGLWIWGLFEEPKYPFLYFYLDVFDSIVLPSGEEEPIFGGEGVPNKRLILRFNHVRDPEKGTVLSNGEVTYKVTEYVKADPFGIGGKVDVGDVVVAGKVDIRAERNAQ